MGFGAELLGCAIAKIFIMPPLERRPCGKGALAVLIHRLFPLNLCYWQQEYPKE